jgi:two-component system, LytTR family, sensor kinase
MYELSIKRSDWLLILATGILFSSLLSMLGYNLLEKSSIQGLLFGGIIGFCITLYSLGLITFMNTKILPSINSVFWNPIAMLFSFFSGYFGFFSGVFIANLFHIDELWMLHEKLGVIAIIIGILTYAMGAIIYSFVNIRNQKEKRDYEFIQSRMKSLETQLNPHFIFNALNSIAELIHQDNHKAETAILKMSSFLRNTMNEKAMIPLSEEVKNAKAYLELENIRFCDRIFIDISENIPKWIVPKFSLQLLIENAIKHGFNKTALHVMIRFELQEKKIIVSNNGKEIQKVQFGVGLNNLKQRLAILCQGNLYVSNQSKNEFTVQLGECDANINR